MLNDDQRARAMGYPYAAPPADCVWTDGRLTPLTGIGDGEIAAGLEAAGVAGGGRRAPILAIGSNRAPVQLARKFHDFPKPCGVAIARARLKDFDIVYGAGIAGYGAVGGATLAPSPGAEVEVWATWLDDAQMARMHETEGLAAGVYALLDLQQITLKFAAGAVWTSALAYVQRRGALTLGGAPVAVAETPATGRRFQALRQPQMQAALRDRFAPNLPLDRFIAENIRSPDIRQARTAALARTAAPFDWPHVEDRTPRDLWRG